MYYFYILKSTKDHRLYYGSTTDLKRRVSEHNRGLVTSTKYRSPLDLIYYEAYNQESLARKRERTIKSSRGTRYALLKRIGEVDLNQEL
jgi:putative endonuclease